MADSASRADDSLARPRSLRHQDLAARISVSAAVTLFVLAAICILEGISALIDDEFYITGIDYAYKFDTTGWGWIHLVLGIIALICASALLSGKTWGRYTALTVAALVILANFMSLPYNPAWSVVVIALGVVVIWAVTTWHPSP
ncbi:DUF7144 family membrane protein [Nocardia aurea]|jgi:hypothetical protein|uniref:DUF7144 family membrane protein n=1 Tax=Nocardia aurea TaxID=2144174 RepID=UPI0033BE20C1